MQKSNIKNYTKNIFSSLNIFFVFVFIFFSVGLLNVQAQQAVYVDAPTLLSQANLFLSPRTATVLQGSTIQIPVFIDTKERSINTINLNITFDPTKMIIVNPSSSNSIIGIWIDPPTYSNTNGTMSLAGVIPQGIVTNSGLITTLTFRAISTGQANVVISDQSKVLANDGIGTEVQTTFDRGTYTILPIPPQGVRVFSETHPFEDTWYNNKNPVIAWDKDPGDTSFSYVLDNKPFTIPDNTVTATDTVTSFQNLGDGIWYFHIKAQKAGIWGATTNFTIRIDSTPPAAFTPTVDMVTSGDTTRALVSFFTTDALSGLDHFEVGVLKANASPSDSPLFVQTDSPYQVPLSLLGSTQVIVRAFDRAGNSIDEPITVSAPLSLVTFLEQNWIAILLLLLLLSHYFYGHKLIPHLKRIFRAVEDEDVFGEDVAVDVKEIEDIKKDETIKTP